MKRRPRSIAVSTLATSVVCSPQVGAARLARCQLSGEIRHLENPLKFAFATARSTDAEFCSISDLIDQSCKAQKK